MAVLYFENLSPDTADAYLAAGLTEELIVRLGATERMSVMSRNAVQRFRRRVTDPVQLGQSLGVAYLVSGSVRRAGNRVRVTVELVRTATGTRIWGDAFDRSDVDLLSLEEAIARTVTTAIIGRLLPSERRSFGGWATRTPQAYNHFLRGNYYLAQRTTRSLLLAIAQYDSAAELDPAFTQAVARAAYGYGLLLAFPGPQGGFPPESLLQRGLERAGHALQENARIADAWKARGLLLVYQHPVSFEGAREAFERAAQLDPHDAEALHTYGDVLLTLGDDSAAARAFHEALAVEPARSITLEHLGILSYVQRRYSDARHWVDSAHAVDPGFVDAYGIGILLHLTTGKLEEARADADALSRLGAEKAAPLPALAIRTAINARAGDALHARQLSDSLLRIMATPVAPSPAEGFLAAWALVAVGDTGQAIDVLERVRPRGANLWFSLRFPELDAIRSHPRFQRLVAESRPPGAREP